MDPLGLEPRASAYSALGIYIHIVAKAAIFQLIYEPSDRFGVDNYHVLCIFNVISAGT
jgi:hypothetical protein